MATQLERRIGLMNMTNKYLGSKIALFIIATELDQKFWPPNSHSKEHLTWPRGFRVTKKLINTT
jgi:hypothetical protein